jgi:hyperosmotically inducible protein
MNTRKSLWGFVLMTSLAASGPSLIAQQSADQNASMAADNTKMNRRDQNTGAPTADQQQNNRSDRDITQQIRKSIMDDKSLSTYAHNVKIITQNGQVTLKGPVRSEEEKQAVEAKATEIAGESKVTNRLAVKPKS